MSTLRTAARPATRAFERLAAHRDSVRRQRDLDEALAGKHGVGVRDDVLAALDRQAA